MTGTWNSFCHVNRRFHRLLHQILSTSMWLSISLARSVIVLFICSTSPFCCGEYGTVVSCTISNFWHIPENLCSRILILCLSWYSLSIRTVSSPSVPYIRQGDRSLLACSRHTMRLYICRNRWLMLKRILILLDTLSPWFPWHHCGWSPMLPWLSPARGFTLRMSWQ